MDMPFLVKNRTPSLPPGCFRLNGIPDVIQTAKQKRESIERSFVNEPLPHANKEREWLISADICLRTERNSSSFIATESFVSGRLFCFASKGLNSIATAFRIRTCTNETEFAERGEQLKTHLAPSFIFMPHLADEPPKICV